MLMLPAAVCKKLPGSGGKVMTHWPCRRSPWVGRMGRRMGDRRAPGPRVVATRYLAAWRAHARAPPAFSTDSSVRPDARVQRSLAPALHHAHCLLQCYWF